MTDRDRLIKIVDDYTESLSVKDLHSLDFANRFADYLLVNGVIVPPCNKYALDLINRLQAEKNDLFYKLAGVMHSVDKWLDGDELKQDEVNRATTMREKTLKIVEDLQAENKRLRGKNGSLESDVTTLNALIEIKNDTIDVQFKTVEKYQSLFKTAKAEAYKEFAKRLYEELRIYGVKDKFNKVVFLNVVDKVKKELVGENK